MCIAGCIDLDLRTTCTLDMKLDALTLFGLWQLQVPLP